MYLDWQEQNAKSLKRITIKEIEMEYILIPFITVLIAGLFSLNLKLGFIVANLTEDTGFDIGFEAMTVFGLVAAEFSLAAYLLN